MLGASSARRHTNRCQLLTSMSALAQLVSYSEADERIREALEHVGKVAREAMEGSGETTAEVLKTAEDTLREARESLSSKPLSEEGTGTAAAREGADGEPWQEAPGAEPPCK